MASDSSYAKIITHLFFKHYKKGLNLVCFERDEIVEAATELHLSRPNNLGDVVYAYRYRKTLPDEIIETQPEGLTWVIVGMGDSSYAFKLVKLHPIVPNESLLSIKIPDSTPEIIGCYALGDEQALLAKVRYNRLIDIFLGVTAYSLQNHLRTKVREIGQIEIDEVYVAVDKFGRQFVIPVQAKGGSDHHGIVQTTQDIAWCASKLPDLICRPISVQFITDTKIAVFELFDDHGEVKVVDEKHYELVPSDMISKQDLSAYALHAKNTR